MSIAIRKPYSFLFLVCLLLIGDIHAAVDPLPSWNDGEAKKRILKFVEDVTTEGSRHYLMQQQRVATFDQDGTLWVEQPIYAEFFFALDSIKTLAPKHPEWATTEPFKSILTKGFGAVEGFTAEDIETIMAATHANITIDQFHQAVQDWLGKAIHPRFKRPFTELVYAPMLEVMQLLRKHHFQIYIVSGGGQEFMRVYADRVYGVPPSNVIGTTGKVKYEYQDGRPVLLKLPEVLFIDDKAGKPEGINLFIGAKPVAAFGNSIGDQQMLEWSQANKGVTLELLVHHDDAKREYAYGPNSKIGTFSDALMQEAKRKSWIVVSMKDDWKVIFPWQKTEQ